MLNVNFAALHGFFYPLGNTPALSLIQDLPFENNAEVLILGCGDIRHVLFTAYADRKLASHNDPKVAVTDKVQERPLDFTCCDLQETIIGAKTSERGTP